MPTKKQLNLFEITGKEPPKDKAPTLLQYLKELPKHESFPRLSRLQLLWFPGKWDNYSLETESFRVSISPRHPLFTPIDNGIVRLLCDTSTAILVRVEDREGTIGLCESNVYGKYVAIGNSGYRFEETEGAN